MWIVVLVVVLVALWFYMRRVVTLDDIDGFYKTGDIYYQIQKKDELGNFSLDVVKPTFDVTGTIMNTNKNLGSTDCRFVNGELIVSPTQRGVYKNNALHFGEVVWTKVPSILDKVVGVYVYSGNRFVVKKSTNGRVVVTQDGLTYKILHIDNGALQYDGVTGVAMERQIMWTNGTTWTRV